MQMSSYKKSTHVQWFGLQWGIDSTEAYKAHQRSDNRKTMYSNSGKSLLCLHKKA